MRNIVFFIIGLIFTISPAYAYEEPNHFKINEAAVGFSQLDQVLKDHLGFAMGRDTMLYDYDEKDKRHEKLRIFQWISRAGEYEDYQDRFLNHFHDPLRSWEYAGLKNSSLGDSALLWAQQGQESFFSSFGEWTWSRARQDYYDALTTEYPAYMHERYWAQCFRGLGQIMHLVSDMSVPAHTRNDAHVLPKFGIGTWHYETWCLENKKILPRTATAGDFPDPSVLFDPQPEGGYEYLAPITGLFDRNQYTGDAPLTGTNIGLTEYSNANFSSKNTIFTACSYQYICPQNDYVNVYCEDVIINGKTYKKRYHQNLHAGIQHLAAVSRLWYETHRNPVPPDIADNACFALLDNKCWEDYASKLIPRAIGYSAALLNYFFRGRLEITPPDRYVYGIADPSSKTFKEIKLKIKNTTPDEAMEGGTLTIVMKYRAPLNPYFDPVTTAPLNTHYIDYNDPYNELYYLNGWTYSVSQSIDVGPISSETAQEFTFTFNDPMPANAADVSLMVVYRGRLGREKDAVVAQYHDLCEPHNLRFWNSTDYFCLNSSLHTPDEITASPDLSGQLDRTGDGKPDVYYFESPVNLYIIFSGSTLDPDIADPPVPTPGETNYTVAFQEIPAGNYGEVAVLQDNDTYYWSILCKFIDSSPANFTFSDIYYTADGSLSGNRTYLGEATETTIDPMGNTFAITKPCWYRLVPIIFRGISMQHGVNFYFTHPNDIECNSALWPDAPDAASHPPTD